jgi:hypothetical protein
MFMRWERIVGKGLEYIDNHTVSVLSKATIFNSEDVIKKWFWPTTDSPDSQRIFPDAPEDRRHQICKAVIENIPDGWDTFRALAQDSRTTLLRFYNITEQVAIWVDLDASKGYQGGGPLSTRPQVEICLTRAVGKGKYAAIMLYIMQNWSEMHNTGEIQDVNDDKYAKRFYHRVWFRLGYLIFFIWKIPSLFPKFTTVLDKVQKGSLFKVYNNPLYTNC